MTDHFIAAFERTVGKEGDYSDNRADRGGRTRFGITEAVARANGYAGEMKDLPFDLARSIYRRQYWEVLRLSEVASVSSVVAEELFDTAVNCGVGMAGKFLQRALNAFNRQGSDYPDVTVDGVVGPVSVDALKAFLYRRGKTGQAVLLKALNGLQAERYIGIAEADRSQEAFVFGWMAQRVELPAIGQDQS